ncbi:hypothetical protein [Ruegeria atlantica]|uniref:hypothetical protein n=1 Tax=Ruegeria atlantica TaxID=81569 RepID=UPI0020C58E97|nr:hypothetical protein [Ruegeria atlantica]
MTQTLAATQSQMSDAVILNRDDAMYVFGQKNATGQNRSDRVFFYKSIQPGSSVPEIKNQSLPLERRGNCSIESSLQTTSSCIAIPFR